MAFNIEEFKSSGLTLGGARPTQFRVHVEFPSVISSLNLGAGEVNSGVTNLYEYTTLLGKAASVPASVISEIEVGYFGRKVKVAGDRTYANWSIQFYNNEDYKIRNAFEQWHENINRPVENIMNASLDGGIAFSSLQNYKTSLAVEHFDKIGNVIKAYKLIGAFPVDVGEITLDWDAQNTIEIYTITFAYYYFLTGPTLESMPLNSSFDSSTQSQFQVTGIQTG